MKPPNSRVTTHIHVDIFTMNASFILIGVGCCYLESACRQRSTHPLDSSSKVSPCYNPAKPGSSSRSSSLRGRSKKPGCWGPEMRSFSPANCLQFVFSPQEMSYVATAAVTTPLFCCTQDRLDMVYMALLTFFLNDL